MAMTGKPRILACITGIVLIVGGRTAASPALAGLGFSPFREGQEPGGTYQTEEEIREDLRILSRTCRRIRTFGNHRVLADIPRWCGEYGMKCWAGAWLGPDADANEASMQRLVKLANEGLPWIEGIIVGNEAVAGGFLAVEQLVEHIRDVREAVTNASLHVTTAEGWEVFAQHARLAEAADVLMLNVHPFWGGLSVDEAAPNVVDTYMDAKETFPTKQIIIGATGWPTAGASHANAVPGEGNQKRFLEAFTKAAESNDIPYFFFSAFDEVWKGRYETGGVGSHWGLFYEDRTPKPAAALSVRDNGGWILTVR